MAIGNITAKAANVAAGTVSELMGSGAYPETEYALAAFLFDRIVQAEKRDAQAEKRESPRDRDYHLELMRACLEVVREGKS